MTVKIETVNVKSEAEAAFYREVEYVKSGKFATDLADHNVFIRTVMERYEPYGQLTNQSIEDCANGVIDIIQAANELIVITKVWDRIKHRLWDARETAVGVGDG